MEQLSLPTADKACGISFLHQMSVSETYHIHTHDFYEIFYVIKGRAMHHINGVSECCTSGTLELIRPRDAHVYSFINRYDMELISIGIRRDIMQEIFAFVGVDEAMINDRNMPLSTVFDARNAEYVRGNLTRMGEIGDADRRRPFGKAMIAQLLIFLAESGENRERIPQWLDELLGEMEKEENYIAGLSRMVELAHVTQSHLNRELKKYLGLTPTEFINSKRIALAGDMLLENRESIISISEKCGFETLSNFYDNFHKVYGCAPKEFVSKHKSI